MKTRSLRRRISATLVALAAVTAGLLIPSSMASAADYEKSFSATVDQVLVNRMGGITVSGTLDCSAEVAEIFGGAELIPPDTTVFVNVNWTASQFVGKNKVVYATYDSGIAHTCFTNAAWWDDVEAPWTWRTLYGFPVGELQWVYATNGKFSPGPIHIELTVVGSPLETGEDTYTFYDFSGWNLRATKSK